MDNKIPYYLPSFAPRGKGKAWIAEAHKPWTPGDRSCVTYIQSKWGDPDVYLLKPGRIYVSWEPEPDMSNDDPDLEPTFTGVKSYFYLGLDGEVTTLSDSEAARRLAELEADCDDQEPLELSVVLKGNKAFFSNSKGREVKFVLSAGTLAKVRRLAEDDNGI